MKTLFLNPIFKTLVVYGLGVAAPIILNHADAPSGGFKDYLGAHPDFGALYFGALYAAHNAWSQYQNAHTPSPDSGKVPTP